MLTTDDINFEEILKNIYDDKIKIEKEKEETEKNLNQIALLRKQLEKDNSDLQKQERELIANAKVQARNILLEAKDDATQIINEMKAISQIPENMAELNSLRNKLNDKIKSQSIIDSNNGQASQKSITPEEIQINLPVYVTTLNKDGIIVSNLSKSNEVQVQIGSMKTSINIKYLEKAKKNNTNKSFSSNSYTKISKSKTVSPEINVIGLSVDDAIPLVDKFLDDCYLVKLKSVRIVHGKGTGKLRSGIHSFLKKNQHVKSHRMGTFGEGEMGVTVVELK